MKVKFYYLLVVERERVAEVDEEVQGLRTRRNKN